MRQSLACRGSSVRRARALALVGGLLFGSCSTEFDATRRTPKRGTLGEEVFGLVCDRVGAQSLREDVTGASFHAVCHPDAAGKWATAVDQSVLPPLADGAVDVGGKPVALEAQRTARGYEVARIEALGRRRADLTKALDAAIPDAPLPLVDAAAGGQACDAVRSGKVGSLREELATTLGRLVALYDDETFPRVTRALGGLLQALQGDGPAREAFARLGARQGYRPLAVAIGAIRPILAYPRLPQLAQALLRLVSEDADPNRAAGPAVPGRGRAAFEQVLRTFREELRVPSEPSPGVLETRRDAALRPVLSRPRTNLELADSLLLATHPTFGQGATRLIVRRDVRGVARVATNGGRLPEPFLDPMATGLPLLDAQGRFVTTDGAPAPSPFFAVEAPLTARRDADGRALGPSGTPLYEYLDVSHTYVGRLLGDLRPLLDPVEARSLLPKLVGGLAVLLGERDADATTVRTYPADPARGTAPVTLRYKAFAAGGSPLADLSHALAQAAAHPDVADSLQLFSTIARDRPAMLARMIDLGLRLKEIADRHPEATLPAQSMLWDDMLGVLAEMARTPGLFEGMLRALADERSRGLGPVVAAYMRNRDEVSYDHQPSRPDDYDALNGTAQNMTTGQPVNADTPLRQPVDRGRPDSGDNRSAFQRFLQLLHDTNGLAACTKENAVAHIDIVWPPGSGIRIKLDYPTNPLVRTVCAFVGATPPSRLPQCGILRFPNVAAMIVDVAVERAQFDIRDECLKKLMDSPLTGLVGGVNTFLEDISGIKGFNLSPTVAGVARLAFFETPFDQWGGYGGSELYPKTRDFLRDILDPVPSMACRSTPWTDPSDGTVLAMRQCDRFEDTLRGRDRNALFPLELRFGQTDFVTAIRPLALAFWEAHASSQLISLLDTLHLHWGSTGQSPDECDPRAPRDDARFCTGDGTVRYEPLLGEMMDQAGLFPTVADLVVELQEIRVQHCDERDARGACVATSERDGVAVLADAVRAVIDPGRNAGLRDRLGRQGTTRNDGTPVAQVTPAYLMIDALKGMDAAFDRYAQAHADGEERRAGWKSARSMLVDALLSIDRSGPAPRLANPGTAAILPELVDVLRAQVTAHCPTPGAPCAWAGGELATRMQTVLSGPTTASMIDLLEAVRADPAALEETQRFLGHLVDQTADTETLAATLSATVDLVQVLGDADNLDPVFGLVSRATALPADPKSAERGLIDGVIGLLWRLFAGGHDAMGKPTCASPVDPHHALATVLRNLVTPMGPDEPAPIEVVLSVIGDVNRADPRRTDGLAPADFHNIGREMSAFLLDRARGLEQFYTVVQAATGGQ